MFTVILYVDHVNTQNCSSIQTEMHVYPIYIYIFGFLWTLFIFESICSKVTLAKSGLKVTVLEKRSILGGRARSWIDGVTRDPVHIGPHVVVSEYPNFFKLLDQLGTLQKILFWTAFFDMFCAWFYLVLLVWKYVREFLFVCLSLSVSLVMSEWPVTRLLRLPEGLFGNHGATS